MKSDTKKRRKAARQFRIGVHEAQGGYILITAYSKRQAEKLALREVETNGMPQDADITHREVSIV